MRSKLGQGSELPLKGKPFQEEGVRRDVEMVLLDLQKDGPMRFLRGFRIQYDTCDSAPAPAAFIRCFEPVKFAPGYGFDVEKTCLLQGVTPVFANSQ